MSDTFSRYLVSPSVSGGKFWEVEVQGATLRVRYGKLGASPSWSSKDLGTPDKAIAEANKQVQKKLAKGYVAQQTSRVEIAPEALATLPLVGIFYFRAHDRSPGGNSDMVTLKVTLWALEGQPPELRVASYRNWDGNHHQYAETPLRIDPAPLLPHLRRCAAELVAAGATDGQYTVHERRVDSDEYDTEWSTIELSLLVPPEGGGRAEDGAILLTFEQEAVASAGYSPRTPSHDPPDRVSQAFLDCVMRMCGVGRVNAFSEGEDDLSRLSGGGRSTDLGYVDREMPLHL
jgi:predicted DNA-binding WGR domain protein